MARGGRRRLRLRGSQADHAARVTDAAREVYAASGDAVGAAQVCDLRGAVSKAFAAAAQCGTAQAEAHWSDDDRARHDANEACGFAVEASDHVERALAHCRGSRGRLPPARGTLRDCTAISEAVDAADNVLAAAEALGVPRTSLYEWLRECSIVPPRARVRGRPRKYLP